MIKLKNENQERLKNELHTLRKDNPELSDILNKLDQHLVDKYRYHLTLTTIYRTQEEQEEVYKNDPKYIKKKFKSPHQLYHAIDMRTRDLNRLQIQEVLRYLNVIQEAYNNHYKTIAIYHDIGLGAHIHIQYYEKK